MFDEEGILGGVKELVALLALDKPQQFCVPTCLDYMDTRYDSTAAGQFGMVFAVPDDIDDADNAVSVLQAIQESTNHLWVSGSLWH
jgi:hypothetical protein